MFVGVFLYMYFYIFTPQKSTMESKFVWVVRGFGDTKIDRLSIRRFAGLNAHFGNPPSAAGVRAYEIPFLSDSRW